MVPGVPFALPISAKPVSGRRDEALRAPGYSALATARPESCRHMRDPGVVHSRSSEPTSGCWREVGQDLQKPASWAAALGAVWLGSKIKILDHICPSEQVRTRSMRKITAFRELGHILPPAVMVHRRNPCMRKGAGPFPG